MIVSKECFVTLAVFYNVSLSLLIQILSDRSIATQARTGASAHDALITRAHTQLSTHYEHRILSIMTLPTLPLHIVARARCATLKTLVGRFNLEHTVKVGDQFVARSLGTKSRSDRAKCTYRV
jgi:hypothetical protein